MLPDGRWPHALTTQIAASRVDQPAGSLIDQLTDSPADQLADSRAGQLTDTRIVQLPDSRTTQPADSYFPMFADRAGVEAGRPDYDSVFAFAVLSATPGDHSSRLAASSPEPAEGGDWRQPQQPPPGVEPPADGWTSRGDSSPPRSAPFGCG